MLLSRLTLFPYGEGSIAGAIPSTFFPLSYTLSQDPLVTELLSVVK